MDNTQDPIALDSPDQLLEAFNDSEWEKVLDDVSHEGHFAISQAFRKAAANAENDGKILQSKVLGLLAGACSMMVQPDKPNEPFGPSFIGGGRRSTIPDDFKDSEIEFFSEAVDLIESPLLKGRLADLVWYLKVPRDIRFALAAIDSYRDIPLDVDTWFLDGEKCLQRAIDLCRMIGTAAGNRVDLIESSIIKQIETATPQDRFFSLRLADVLISNGLGKSQAKTIASKLNSLADNFHASNDFYASGGFYKASSKWFKFSGDEEKSVVMTIAEAEALVKDAESRLESNSPSHAVAASFLENAVQVYRSIPRVHRSQHQVDLRMQELRLLITEHGKQALEEMATISGPEIDIRENVEQARNAVRGKSIDKALLAFANLHSISVAQLRQSAIDSLSQSSFRALIPVVFTSPDGRVIRRTSGTGGSVPSESDEKEVLAEMNRFHYLPVISLAVQGLILPALDVLILEHRVPEAVLVDLARRSPIVPKGREILFGKALANGFNKDFATAIHLLGPQIENMVRYHLKSAGVVTSHLDQDGIEMENSLSTLIDLPETSVIFGDDLTYEIKALFCDQVGPNLRNNVAHGLLDDRECYSIDSVYAWWLGLKLVFITFWNSLAASVESDESEEANEDR